MTSTVASLDRSRLAQRFRFAENGTTFARDAVARVTTFIVMSYIIFVNPGILTSVTGPNGAGQPFEAVLTSRARPLDWPESTSTTSRPGSAPRS